MADVAAMAGVSGQTVSRVANGRENVDPETRARVQDAMAQLGYRPNSAARALRSGRFRSIGVIMFSLASYGNTRTLDAVASVAAEAGYSLTVITVQSATQSDVSGAFVRLAEHAVDGVIILIETHRLGERELALPTGLPVVVVDSSADYPYPVVDNDQTLGARLATEHLLDLGHETVSHISGPRESFAAERRRAAWHDTLVARGAAVPEVHVGDWTAESGYEIGRALAGDHRVTAVFVANDRMALGLLRALHEADRPVPASVSVVGYDDAPESANFWPPLTTVRQYFDRIGAAAVRSLLTEIDGGEVPAERTLVPTELVVRASSGPRR
ncbi:LacI family DNA-binding transcriptional regulator [Microbacterium sp. NE2HP2]|uniref:LacI family DNA-binding transcriptional regulator n=1 Tax=Microbacterium plantarum TaxID=1816425 RepID=UPI002365E3E4|nr:LacI family DNA-binding transcriptional regulator [Microbacterium plantarum]MDD7944336.1 LacI family DNA-binding transcriptional regulator [Microbacterium plantarum]WRK17911.1 LacI family DNA-binding transcriptional regulator [Microbacterium plantarum]